MNKTEGKIQTECYTWFHNTYPKYRGLLCYNLNNSKNKVDGARNKALGLQPGRSDLVFYWGGVASMIEMKTETGTQSPAQKEWQKLIEENGFDYYIRKDLEEFQILIKNIMEYGKCK